MPDVYALPPGFTIVSGGQTGADRAELDWAIEHGVAHAGWVPKGRKSEDGPVPARYQLREAPSGAYLQRTEWNVRDSDATVIFTLDDRLDGGSKRTADFARKLGKPWLHMRPAVHPKFLARFLGEHAVMILNVAGKGESTAPGIPALVLTVLSQAMQ